MLVIKLVNALSRGFVCLAVFAALAIWACSGGHAPAHDTLPGDSVEHEGYIEPLPLQGGDSLPLWDMDPNEVLAELYNLLKQDAKPGKRFPDYYAGCCLNVRQRCVDLLLHRPDGWSDKQWKKLCEVHLIYNGYFPRPRWMEMLRLHVVKHGYNDLMLLGDSIRRVLDHNHEKMNFPILTSLMVDNETNSLVVGLMHLDSVVERRFRRELCDSDCIKLREDRKIFVLVDAFDCEPVNPNEHIVCSSCSSLCRLGCPTVGTAVEKYRSDQLRRKGRPQLKPHWFKGVTISAPRINKSDSVRTNANPADSLPPAQ